MNSVIQNLYNLYDLTEFLKKNETHFQQASFTAAYIKLLKSLESITTPIAPAEYIADFYIGHVQSLFSLQATFEQQDAIDFLEPAFFAISHESFDQRTNMAIKKLILHQFVTRISHPTEPAFFVDTAERPQTIFSMKNPMPPFVMENKNILTIQAALEKELSPEEIEYKFDDTRGFEKAWSSKHFIDLSEYFIIHLKIFQGNEKEQYPFHIDEFLNIPLRNEPIQYELIGIIAHVGSARGGHYTALVKRPTGMWYECNDSVVTPYADKQRLMSEHPFFLSVSALHQLLLTTEHLSYGYIPYILFYKKINQPQHPGADYIKDTFKKTASNLSLFTSLF